MDRKVEELERSQGYQGFYRLEQLRLRHRLFSGAMGPAISRELFVRPDAACVLPYDIASDSVVLLEQFRVGALDKSANPWLLEVVAGLIDAGEQPQQTACREAQEEAGLVFSGLLPVLDYYPSPGGSNEYVHLFLGLCDSTGLHGQVHGMADEGEDIRLQVVDFAGALDMLAQGRINNAAAIICLQWLALNRARLREEYASQIGQGACSSSCSNSAAGTGGLK